MNGKRKFVRTVSFLTALIVALGGWGIANTVKLSKIKSQVRASQERALTQLGTYLDDIDINLRKCMYLRGGALLSDISSKLWRSSASAKESLSEITDGNTEVSGVYKFLSQVGEYTVFLNEKLASGGKVSQSETESLKKLKEYSEELSARVNYLISQQASGGLDFEEVKSTLQAEGEGNLYLGEQLNDTNQILEDYPTLIYDGPFSDHITDKKSEMTKGLNEITQDKARKKAARFLELDESELYFLSKTESNLGTYTFYSTDKTVSVTVNGGFVSSFLSSRLVGEENLSSSEAVEKAREFLKNRGYESIKESYYSTNDGICTVNFAYYEGGVTYYTDLIKVSVALDNGEITAFDATGYLMNHKKRTIPDGVKYTLSSGERLVKESLTVLNSKKVFIPNDSGSEEFSYEYHCRDEKSQEVLIYIDPVTGQESDVLILLYADGGVLTK